MIVEMVTCDACDVTETMRTGMVPADWASFGGKHYCTLTCVMAAHGARAGGR